MKLCVSEAEGDGGIVARRNAVCTVSGDVASLTSPRGNAHRDVVAHGLEDRARGIASELADAYRDALEQRLDVLPTGVEGHGEVVDPAAGGGRVSCLDSPACCSLGRRQDAAVGDGVQLIPERDLRRQKQLVAIEGGEASSSADQARRDAAACARAYQRLRQCLGADVREAKVAHHSAGLQAGCQRPGRGKCR